MKNEKETVPEAKQQNELKQKRKGKIAQVYELHQKGISAKEIAEKMNLSERTVRSYVWRAANPENYKALLQRYFAKKKQKQEKRENQLAAKKQKKAEQEEKRQ